MDDHLRVEDHGTVVLIFPVSEAATEWLAENVGEPDHGAGYSCDPRSAEAIVWGCAGAVLRRN